MSKYVDIKEKNGELSVSIFYKGHVSVTIKDSRQEESYKSNIDVDTITFTQNYIHTADQISIADDLYICIMDQINQMLTGKYENKQLQHLSSCIHDGIQMPSIKDVDPNTFIHGDVQGVYIHDGLQGKNDNNR